MDKFRENEDSLSVAAIDIDWHVIKFDQVSHTRCTGFT